MEEQFEKLKSNICKEICEFLRNKSVDEGIVATTGIKILAFGNGRHEPQVKPACGVFGNIERMFYGGDYKFSNFEAINLLLMIVSRIEQPDNEVWARITSIATNASDVPKSCETCKFECCTLWNLVSANRPDLLPNKFYCSIYEKEED